MIDATEEGGVSVRLPMRVVPDPRRGATVIPAHAGMAAKPPSPGFFNNPDKGAMAVATENVVFHMRLSI